MDLNQKQRDIKRKIEQMCAIMNVDQLWAVAIALTESSLGMHQKSPTGCLGVFQMSNIAMKDLRLAMEKADDDLIDIACGVAFLRLLYQRWGNINDATIHFCDPNVRVEYLNRMLAYMHELRSYQQL